jgi:DNA-binding XRE family transcriptional regulator
LTFVFDNAMLRSRYQRAGYTRQTFADAVHVQIRTVYRWEAGDTEPDPRAQILIDQALSAGSTLVAAHPSRRSNKQK